MNFIGLLLIFMRPVLYRIFHEYAFRRIPSMAMLVYELKIITYVLYLLQQRLVPKLQNSQ